MFVGITCPRAGRIVTSQGIIPTEGEPCGDEALTFTRDLCMQREVTSLERTSAHELNSLLCSN